MITYAFFYACCKITTFLLTFCNQDIRCRIAPLQLMHPVMPSVQWHPLLTYVLRITYVIKTFNVV